MTDQMSDKIMTLSQAVERFVHDGDQIAIGGFTVSRNPMALTREIIRQGKKNLYLTVHSHGQALELLIGAGLVERVELAYGGVARFAPTGIRFRKAVKQGELEVEDYSNYQMTLRFMAGAMGLPFAATPSGLDSDIVNREGFRREDRGRGKIPAKKLTVIDNPLDPTAGQVVILPPLNPDVALMHAQYVGFDGTVRIKGLTFADVEQAKAAKRVIVTCEELVPSEYLRRDPDQNQLPHFLIDAVIPAPYGAHPTACHLFYDYDPMHLNAFKKIAHNDETFRAYLDEWVYGIEDQAAYLDKVGQADLQKIKSNPAIGYAPGLDRR